MEDRGGVRGSGSGGVRLIDIRQVAVTSSVRGGAENFDGAL